MDWIHETKLQTVNTPAHWLSQKHNEVFSSFTEEIEAWCFYLGGEQVEKGGGHFKSPFNSAEDDSLCLCASYQV